MITQVYSSKRTSVPVTSMLMIAALLLLPSCGSKSPVPDKPVTPSVVAKKSSKPKVVKQSRKPKIAKASAKPKVAKVTTKPKITPKPKVTKPTPKAKIAKTTSKPKVAKLITKPKVSKQNPKPKVTKAITKPKTSKSLRLAKATAAGNPCNMADPGYGIYYPWVNNLKIGRKNVRMLMPKSGALTSNNGFDLIIHFHGGNAIRKAIADTARGAFVVGVDLGAGSGAYERPFKNPQVFRNLLKNIKKEVARYTKKSDVHIRRLALTGWSAGYGAIRAILRQKTGKKVDAVVLLDGLHSNYDRNSPLKLRASQLSPFVKFAKHAAKGQKFMFVSHSSIVPPGYASTTETSHYLAKKLGIGISKSSAQDSPHLTRYEEASTGGFLMRGYRGKGKADHCAQIGLITTMAATLEQRWDTPLAQGKSYKRPTASTKYASVRNKRKKSVAKAGSKKHSKSASKAKSRTVTLAGWDAA